MPIFTGGALLLCSAANPLHRMQLLLPICALMDLLMAKRASYPELWHSCLPRHALCTAVNTPSHVDRGAVVILRMRRNLGTPRAIGAATPWPPSHLCDRVRCNPVWITVTIGHESFPSNLTCLCMPCPSADQTLHMSYAPRQGCAQRPTR